MPDKLYANQPDFPAQLERLLASRDNVQAEVGETVSAIIADVKTAGDAALVRYTQTFDRWEASAETLAVSKGDMADARGQCSGELLSALTLAAERIADYSRRQLPGDEQYTDDTGTTLGWKWTPLASAGLYVPGGLAAYPSSVLMNAVPAKAAGVERLVVTVPAPDGHLNPAILAACNIAGVDEVYRIGGAQAIAALAYGTATIRAVDKIVGPGNAWVAESKRQVFGRVGIDMIAGPSEILVVADNQNNPEWIAADLLSQAEHDRLAQSVLITDDEAFADRVIAATSQQLTTLQKADIARAAWDNHGAVIIIPSLAAAAGVINAIAPEHLELAVEHPETIAAQVTHAGAIFLGRYTPEAIGDYIAGPSHVLPTSRTARFSSGLSVFDFLKRTSIIGCSQASFNTLAPPAETLAESEGLQAHFHSMRVRHEP